MSVSGSSAISDRESVTTRFSSFAAALDAHHDARDRVIKASRDITAASKKIIFALQRLKYADAEVQRGDSDKTRIKLPPKIDSDIAGLGRKIKDAFGSVRDDLQGAGAWRYQRQISGAIQEYIEALLFREYLMERRILSHEEVQTLIGDEFLVTYTDYILGLFDTTGELMRFAITNLSDVTSSHAVQVSPIANQICQLLRTLRIGFSGVRVNSSSHLSSTEFVKKMNTLHSSVDKVERAVYSLVVRGSELPEGWMPGDDDGDGQI
ncbi:Translin [Lipomyces tetrasporus]|uniref:Translin n=1 Tax=Lipomyces tetrasporus TaxID=54092 RepID=A0AAD7QU73_9ASCO|nr:Translin [Lipomyces tetrasporus]KAJ8101046.1 Translin [Lipomyces tetrasporus]